MSKVTKLEGSLDDLNEALAGGVAVTCVSLS